MKKIMIFIISVFLLNINSSYAIDFNYKTNYWFNKIELFCKSGICQIKINNKYKGEFPYTVSNMTAYTEYDNYSIELNLNNGDFKYERKSQ